MRGVGKDRLLPRHGPFNSLFEMQVELRVGWIRKCKHLSILYLRCSLRATQEYVRRYAFNSLFEMHATAAVLKHVAEFRDFQFSI